MKYLSLLGLSLVCLGASVTLVHAELVVPKIPQPGPNDGRIAYVVARMLEQNHYRQQSFDDSVSEKFFDGYIEALDPQRLHFTQSDIADFSSLRTNLDNLTLTGSGVADPSPAFAIFSRFLTRLEERVNYNEVILKTPTNFDFTSDEKVLLNRKDESFPKDANEAQALWKQRLRSEYLQEKLVRADSKKKSAKPDTTETKKPGEKESTKTDAEQIVEKLSNRYQRNLKTFREWDNDDVLQAYLNSLTHVYDPHSDYFGAAAAENFAIGMNLQLFGIGAQLSFVDGYCTLEKLFPGGPAAKSGKLEEKERVVGVAQGEGPFVDVVEMNLNKTVRLIRGEKGTTVRLAVIPPVEDTPRREITLVRDEIKLEDQAAKGKIIDMPGENGKSVRLGVIDLPSFYASLDGKSTRFTSPDVEKLLKKFVEEKVDGVILDLRRNGGGSLDEAIKVTGLFIKEGPVVQVRAPDRRKIVQSDLDGEIAYDGPLVVMTSRFSASASEIVAGALQDYGRAVLVGDCATHGKGTVQNLNPLRRWVTPTTPSATNDPGEVKMTISKFYRAGGASTQLKGVMPDVVLPSWVNYSKDIGEAALENALPWDTITTARFTKLDLVEPFLPELARRSNERVAASREYDYIREDIERYRKRQEDKTISLNERERIREKDADEQREKLRNKERLARKEPEAKVYEITLKLADQPGLPKPVEKTNTITAKIASEATSTNADDEEDEKPPAMDAGMLEAQSILVDYIGLLAKRSVAATTSTTK
jgi:carboxyl-terminal processing protease